VAAVWVGRDDNTPMKRVTGGGAPAEIWRAFMATSLPKLQAQTIPGGAPLTPSDDVIGNLLSAANGLTPTPESPTPDGPDEPTGPAAARPQAYRGPN
jgi:penicillin-binding protein 1A